MLGKVATSPFGGRCFYDDNDIPNLNIHSGLDYSNITEDFYSVCNGYITYVSPSETSSRGYYVEVTADIPDSPVNVKVTYMHLEPNHLPVVQDYVGKGDYNKCGRAGDTGYVTGEHLHVTVEIRVNNSWIAISLNDLLPN